MTIPILEGTNIYDNGQLQGKLELTEGDKAGPFVICETVTGYLKSVEPSLEEASSVFEGSDGKKTKHLLTLEGRFQMADTENRNGRVYPEKLWEKIFNDKDLVKSVDRGEMLGECDHPKDGETRLSRVAGKVTKLWRNPENLKEVLGRFAIFDNEAGRQLKAIHEGGGRLGVSSRGTGSVVRLGGKDVVQEDFKLKTWDVVHGPSTPGAYPNEVTESTETFNEGTIQESDMSKRLEELASRLKKLQERDISELSTDAIGLLSESAQEIQDTLVNENFGEQAPKASKLVMECTQFIGNLPVAGAALDKKYCVGKLTESGELILNEGSKEDLQIERPDTAQGVLEAIAGFDLLPTENIQEALKTIKTAYRDVFELEGKLEEHEIRGINESAKVMIKEAERLEESCPLIVARIGLTLNESDTPVVIEARSEGELRKKISEVTSEQDGPVYVEIDRSAAIRADYTEKFNGLLEAQTLKAEAVVEKMANSQADLTEMSAKLTGATKLIEAYAARCKDLTSKNKSLVSERDAACTILDEMASAFDKERLFGAVAGVAASNPNVTNITESLAQVDDFDGAIEVAKSIFESKLPKVIREPINEDNVAKALEADAKVRKDLTEKASETIRPKMDLETKRELELMERLVERMPQRPTQ